MKRLIACLLVFSLLLSGCSSHIEALTQKLRSYKSATAAIERPEPVGAGIAATPMGHFPDGFKSKYPLTDGDWSIQKPLFDPLGGQSAYAKVEYSYHEGELKWLDREYRPTSRKMGGGHWLMDIESETSVTAEDILHLEKYALDLGGEILSSTGEEIAFVIKKEDEGYWWWGKAYVYGHALRIEVWRERRVKVGEPLIINKQEEIEKNGKEYFYFSTSHTEGKLQSMAVEILAGYARIKGMAGYSSGGYRRSLSYQVDINAERAPLPDRRYHLDDIPQEPGDTMWEVSLGSSELTTVKIQFDDIADITPVKYGEGMGALLVKKAPWGSASVMLNGSNNHTTFETHHPDMGSFSANGDQTPEGDTLFWLPPGYWELDIMGYKSRAIPVSEGEMTVVEAPTNLRKIEVDESGESLAAGEKIEEHGMTFLSKPVEQGEAVKLDFLLFDSANKNPEPTKENTKITENSLDAEILSIEPLPLPPNVVLVLDSSGSMEGQLEQTIESAKAFIEGLPDDAAIQLVDFDGTVKPFDGTTKAEAIKNLEQVTLGGSTALYGATIAGLDMLSGKERPTLVLFTDGKNEPAAGGLTDKSQVVNAIAAAGVPIYTIGFGPEHAPINTPDPNVATADPNAATPDPNAATPDSAAQQPEPEYKQSDLTEFAALSDGKYYSAADQNALKKVFDAIAARLGHAFTATYKRPQESSLSDVPVVMLIVDNSGSMGGVMTSGGDRMENVKAMYRQFIMDAPENLMMQVMTFDFINQQMLTTNKIPILQSLGDLEGSGGTPIIETTQIGYQSLMDVATSKRILVYITDEAMLANDEAYGKILNRFKESEIQTLWVGMVDRVESYEPAFQWVAEQAGGSYAIGGDPGQLTDGLKKMLAAMNEQKTSTEASIGIDITLDGEDGQKQGFKGMTQTVLKPLPPKEATTAPPEAMKISVGQPIGAMFQKLPETEKSQPEAEKPAIVPLSSQYGQETAALLTGGDAPSTDTKIISRVPLGANGKSEAVEISATDLFRIGKLRGIDPPKGMTYLAVSVTAKNLFADRPFSIPDFMSHFYMSVNDAGAYPASACTWLAETPLPNPGENAIQIEANETKNGALVFLVPDEAPADLQLNFYDTTHGHIELVLMGKAKKPETPMEKLPTSAPAKLSDAFSLSVTGYTDVIRIGTQPAPEGMVYRIIEGEITSNVQALLDMRPAERFYLDIETAGGAFRLPIAPMTATVPMGYLAPKLLAPGSVNTFRWVFEVPQVLANAKAEIYGDISGGAVRMPVKKGGAYPVGSKLGTYNSEYVDMTVNELGRLSDDEYNKLLYSFDKTAEKAAEEERLAQEKAAAEEAAEESREAEAAKAAAEADPEAAQPEKTPEQIEEERAAAEEAAAKKAAEKAEAERIAAEKATEEASASHYYVVADVTVTDKADGYGTNNLGDSIGLVSNRISPSATAGGVMIDGTPEKGLADFAADEFVRRPNELTNRLALGIDDNFAVMDGETRRGLIVFEVNDPNFSFGSEYFPDLKLPLPTGKFTQKELLKPKAMPDDTDTAFADALSAELSRVIEQYNATQIGKPKSVTAAPSREFSLTQSPGKIELPSPSSAMYGIEKLKAERTPDEALALLRSLVWRPSYAKEEFVWTPRYSPAAVLTQGWGTEHDLAILAEQLLSRAGLRPQRMEVKLTDAGRQALVDYLKIVPQQPEKTEDGEEAEPPPDKEKPLLDIDRLPAFCYNDASGAAKVLVIPFMKDLAELEGYAYLPGLTDKIPQTGQESATISVTVQAVPLSDKAKGTGPAGLAMGDLFGSLSEGMSAEPTEGENEEQSVDLAALSQSFPLETLSDNAVDIGFAVGDEKAWVPFMETPTGKIPGKTGIEKVDYKPTKILYTVKCGDEEYTHEVILAENETLDGVFVTLGVNLPELYGEGLSSLSAAVESGYDEKEKPNEVSSLKWLTRNNLYRFISQQTACEDNIARQLGLSVGRTTKMRCIAVTARVDPAGEKLLVSINLVSAFNQIHNGPQEAQSAFNIMTGLGISKLEGLALGENALAFDDVWDKCPKDMQLVLFESDLMGENIPLLRAAGVPETLLARMERTSHGGTPYFYLLPDSPAKIGGKERWAMLEINGETYETISVLDNGENSGMAEYILLNHLDGPDAQDYLGYAFGGMVGTSVGIWSMCTATLETSDYADAVTAAQKTCKAVNERVQDYFSRVSAVGDLRGAYDFGGGVGGPGGKLSWKDTPEGQWEFKFKPEIGGAPKGFEVGIEFYFKHLT